MRGRALLLQGPMGPLFRRLAEELRAEGNEVFKINFNGGDELFFKDKAAVAYTGSLADWPVFFTRFIREHRIDRIFLFGDCRAYHAAAVAIAKLEGVAVYVFEEGYVRPYYITMEPWGVNGKSSLPADPAAYRVPTRASPAKPEPVQGSYRRMAFYAIAYALALWFTRRRFPQYRHHRELNPYIEAVRWGLSWGKKLYRSVIDRPVTRRLCGRLKKQFFLVPLQVHCDAQVTHHSSFESVEQFIEEVTASFAVHAPADVKLVFKHHPMDRSYRDYSRLLRRLAHEHGLQGRLIYVHECWLPGLLRAARGVVVINSTVGMSAVHHRTPTKVLGRAVYDMEGLTDQKSLDAFWNEQAPVDSELFKRFLRYLKANVLANGNFYAPLAKADNPTGIRWLFGSVSAASAPERALALLDQVPEQQESRASDSAGRNARQEEPALAVEESEALGSGKAASA